VHSTNAKLACLLPEECEHASFLAQNLHLVNKYNIQLCQYRWRIDQYSRC